MKHLTSRIGTLGIAGALVAILLTPACQSYRHLPPPETGPASREAEASPPSATDPQSSSALVGSWTTLSGVGEVQVVVHLSIGPDGSVLLLRTPQDTMIREEASGMVVDESRRITMDDGSSLEIKMLQDRLVTTDPLNGLETVYERL